MMALRVSVITVISTLALAAAVAVSASPADADTTYLPANPNGQKVYLSRACHDPDFGSDCISNAGCDGYSENDRSRVLARDTRDSLLARGYAVRVGNQGVTANINSSNNWNATMHLPLHSNAVSGTCPDHPLAGRRGTELHFQGVKEKELGQAILYYLEDKSPGTDDRTVQSGFNELYTDAPSAYLESEYHDWINGVNWLRNSDNWAVWVAAGVDRCRGYPREDQPPRGGSCSW